MMKISTKGRYGTRLMVDLAVYYGNGPVQLKDIAKRQEVSAGYLEQLVPQLKSAGLLISTRGRHGGYSLSRNPGEITARDVVQVLEGDLNIVECIAKPSTCSRTSVCVTRELWVEVTGNVLKTLGSYTLEDLAKNSRRQLPASLMYNI